MKTILNSLIRYLAKRCEVSGRMYQITGEASGKQAVYLVRYIVIKSRFFCFYIHRFMRSDSSDPHDHPWNFVTYIVEGGYDEHFYNVNKPDKEGNEYKAYWSMNVNTRKPGSFAFRRATDIHRVVIPRSFEMAEIEQAPLTACLMFKRQRHWGFWPLSDNGSKFVDWRKYLDIRPQDPRIEGSE